MSISPNYVSHDRFTRRGATKHCLTAVDCEAAKTSPATITTMQLVIWVVAYYHAGPDPVHPLLPHGTRLRTAPAREDLKMASLLGINTDRVIAAAFVIGAAMAAVAGVLLGQFYGVINRTSALWPG